MKQERNQYSTLVESLSANELRNLTKEEQLQVMAEIRAAWQSAVHSPPALLTELKAVLRAPEDIINPEANEEVDDISLIQEALYRINFEAAKDTMTLEKAIHHISDSYVIVTGKKVPYWFDPVLFCNAALRSGNQHRVPFGRNSSYYHMTEADTSAQTLEDAIINDIFRSLYNGTFLHNGKTFVPTMSKAIVEYAQEKGLASFELTRDPENVTSFVK
jgi:hypothetical protein